MTTIRALWAKEAGNFGDCLTPWILGRLGFSAALDRRAGGRLLLAGTASVLSLPGDVAIGAGSWGPSGWPRDRLVLAARGPLGAPGAPLYADAGLALRRLASRKGGKGILLLRRQGDWRPGDEAFWRLSLSEPPEAVIEAVSEADAVVSDGLHGMIAAHALSIPFARITNVYDPLPRWRFRWEDYSASFGMAAPRARPSAAEAAASLSPPPPGGALDEKADKLLALLSAALPLIAEGAPLEDIREAAIAALRRQGST